MPKMQNITLLDGKTTPASHVFTPQRITPQEVAQFRERIAAQLLGQPELSVQLRERNDGLYAVDLRLVIPTVATVTGPDGIPKKEILYSNSAFVQIKVPTQGTTQERKDLRVLLSNALLNADIAAVIDNGEALIGG
jgi:hypothetical protein